jgi:hypothetical protein
LLKTKNYYISCPNSQENSDMSDFIPNEGLKDLRKKLHNIKTKNNIPKIKSKMICKSNKKQENEYGLNIDMDLIDEKIDLNEIYSGEENDEYELITNNVNIDDKENDNNNKFNSYSILQILQEKTGLD